MQLTHLTFCSPAWDELHQNLLSLFHNGGVEFAQFQVGDISLRDWFATRTPQDEAKLVQALLTHSVVAEALPHLQIQNSLAAELEIELGSAFTMDGEIAQALVRGGAYSQFPGTGAAAKKLGQNFCHSLFGYRYTDIQIYKTHSAWCRWFGNVLWDKTWIGLDFDQNQIWILCLTDSD